MTLFADSNPVDLPLPNRLLVVALVVLVHVLLVWSWVTLPSFSKPVHREMSVSVTLPGPPQPAPVPPEPKPEVKPVVKPEPVESQQVQPAPQVATPDTPVEAPPQEEMPPPAETSSAPSRPAWDPPAPASPVREPDREPDYQAAYLKNPPPAYPMVARRMGWQGRVVLSVEVLASGLPGQIKLHQSSGHDVLDDAAMRAVSSWRFIAARQGGQVVTKSFLVPIPFILKEAE